MRSSTSEACPSASVQLRVGVICDVRPRSWPGFVEDTIALGRAIAKAGFHLICVGNAGGAADLIARAVRTAGGRVAGIACADADEHTAWIESIDERVSAADSQHRKRLMYEMADAFIVLPGGAFVLETLMELITWMQKGRLRKPVYLISASGYWEPLLKMFEHMQREDYLPHDFYGRFLLISDPLESVADLLRVDGELHRDVTP